MLKEELEKLPQPFCSGTLLQPWKWGVMTDVEPGRCDESPEHSGNREIEHRTGDSSNADDTRRGSHLPSLAENGGLSAQGDERLPEHDAIARVVEEGLDTELRMISASISRSGPLYQL